MTPYLAVNDCTEEVNEKLTPVLIHFRGELLYGAGEGDCLFDAEDEGWDVENGRPKFVDLSVLLKDGNQIDAVVSVRMRQADEVQPPAANELTDVWPVSVLRWVRVYNSYASRGESDDDGITNP